LDVVQSIFLGIIQGLTEFLPVSSSAHLTFAEQLFKIDPKWRVSLDVLLHLGTTLALIGFFLKRILKILAGLFSPFVDTRRENWNIVLAIAVGTIPAVIAGYLLKNKIDTVFANPMYSAAFLLITGVVLFLTRKTNGERTKLSVADGLIIGIAQAIAIMPGISRSGSTIAAALFLGFARPEAFEFSFLLSIPAVVGAALLKLKGSGILHDTGPISHSAMATGFLVSAIVGMLALYMVKKILMQRRLWYFSFYCWALGIAALVYFGLVRHG
jgi:undecaprenyl-diphosphatase